MEAEGTWEVRDVEGAGGMNVNLVVAKLMSLSWRALTHLPLRLRARVVLLAGGQPREGKGWLL